MGLGPVKVPLSSLSLLRFSTLYVWVILFYFSITVYIQYYFLVVLGVQLGVRQSYTLQSVCTDTSSMFLVPYRVITILLTIFPVLYFTSLGLLYD